MCSVAHVCPPARTTVSNFFPFLTSFHPLPKTGIALQPLSPLRERVAPPGSPEPGEGLPSILPPTAGCSSFSPPWKRSRICVKLRPRSPRVECPCRALSSSVAHEGLVGPASVVPSWSHPRPPASPRAGEICRSTGSPRVVPHAQGDGRRKASYSKTTRLGAVFERSAPLPLRHLRFQWSPTVRRRLDAINGPFPFPYRLAPFSVVFLFRPPLTGTSHSSFAPAKRVVVQSRVGACGGLHRCPPGRITVR